MLSRPFLFVNVKIVIIFKLLRSILTKKLLPFDRKMITNQFNK